MLDDILVDYTVGLEEADQKEIKQVHTFPNPISAGEHLTIEFQNQLNSNPLFELFDASGRRVREARLSGLQQSEVPIHGLPSGFYFYRVMTEGQILGVGKLLVVE